MPEGIKPVVRYHTRFLLELAHFQICCHNRSNCLKWDTRQTELMYRDNAYEGKVDFVNVQTFILMPNRVRPMQPLTDVIKIIASMFLSNKRLADKC